MTQRGATLRKVLAAAAIVLLCSSVAFTLVRGNAWLSTSDSASRSSSAARYLRPPSSSSTPSVGKAQGHTRHERPSVEGPEEGTKLQRGLRPVSLAGEGLLLAVANSDEDAIDEFGDRPDWATEDISRWHKPFLPLNAWDVASIVLAALGLMIAAAGGIGGGGILVPIYILVGQFSPKWAVPLSNVTIFGGAITNTFLNMKKRHPLADRPLVDWDLILVMEPLTIGGALVGSFVQKVLPEIFLTLSMVLLLLVTADRTLRKGIKAFRKESENQEAVETSGGKGGLKISAPMATDNADSTLLANGTKSSVSYGAASVSDDGLGTFSPAELSPTASPANVDVTLGVENEDSMMLPSTAPSTPVDNSEVLGEEKKVALQQLLDEERNTSFAKVGIMTAVFVVLLCVNLLKGGGAFPSPVGIECGSVAYWATTVLCFVYLGAVSMRVREYLVSRWRLKTELGYKYMQGDVEWTPINTVRYPCICFFAGFFAGMFGVGGGIVKGPLMLEMGVHPMVSSSTSAVMILYTSFTATTSYIVFGLLKADYAIALFFLGLVATAAGQYGTDYLIQKFKRPSFIILSIGSVVALSAALMGLNGLYDILNPAGGEGEEGGICSAGV